MYVIILQKNSNHRIFYIRILRQKKVREKLPPFSPLGEEEKMERNEKEGEK